MIFGLNLSIAFCTGHVLSSVLVKIFCQTTVIHVPCAAIESSMLKHHCTMQCACRSDLPHFPHTCIDRPSQYWCTCHHLKSATSPECHYMMSNIILWCPDDIMLFLVGMFAHAPSSYAVWIPSLGVAMPKWTLSFLLHRVGNCAPSVHTVTICPRYFDVPPCQASQDKKYWKHIKKYKSL